MNTTYTHRHQNNREQMNEFPVFINITTQNTRNTSQSIIKLQSDVTRFLDTLHVYVSCRHYSPNAPQRPQSAMQQVHRSHGRRTSRCHTLPIPVILHVNPTERCVYKITGKSYKFDHFFFQIKSMDIICLFISKYTIAQVQNQYFIIIITKSIQHQRPLVINL